MSDITLNSVATLEDRAEKPLKNRAFQENWSPRKTLSFTIGASSFLWAVLLVSAWQLF